MICGSYRVSAQRPSLRSSLSLALSCAAGVLCRVEMCCEFLLWDVGCRHRNLTLGALMQLGPAVLRGDKLSSGFSVAQVAEKQASSAGRQRGRAAWKGVKSAVVEA